ncbi:propionate catabolism operon transcriptional regulator [Povalibacter uvarum]|uniref:Propionate catabolism operon transcriptional regulator n=1 Tax=Povalibacter uvarum TaxID=732238 RepID=A0A841HPS0_9GAMM|nr:propionate catabolism operon regulatory protein PrpR [Povalibacter uvarum]MBB6093915.1 propionate catabolism operon transcriptional regulator [Povalibacter uvarum]
MATASKQGRLVGVPPRIVAVGLLHRLRTMLQELAPSYRDVASVEILEQGFDAAVARIRELHAERPIDALVAAGSNGAYLRQHLELPVVSVRVGGFDVMRALARARGISSRIALVTHGAVPDEVQLFDELFSLGIEQRSYRSEEEARDCIKELRAKGIEVVVAPGLVVDLAEEAGMHGIFLYSTDAVREALDDALEVARLARIEASKRDRLNTILAHLHDAVVAVDAEERIESVNLAMERLLGQPATQLLGRRLSEVASELTLMPTLREQRTEIDELQKVGAQSLIVSRLPIIEQGTQTGAVLTAKDPDAIQRVDRHLRTQRERPSRSVRFRLTDLLGSCAPIVRARTLASQFARSDATTLIIGESGTGKELLAQGIHMASARANQPFIALNCAAFPESLLESELFGYEEGAFTGARRGGKIGLFEAAHTGTIFLDEIGEMPVSLQTRMLRVLQEREVLRIGAIEPTRIDIRVIAATHRNLEEQIASGGFRRDLYYRLNILRLDLPSLRDRLQDLPELAGHVLRRVADRFPTTKLTEDLVRELVIAGAQYRWPGNVRELENLIERLATVRELPSRMSARDQLRQLIPELFAQEPSAKVPSLASHREETELQMIERVLAECGGDRRAACEKLGIGRSTLWRKLSRGRAAG